MIDLDQRWLSIVKQILIEHLPAHCHVWAFGSRVNGHPKPLSDLDIALVSDAPIAETILMAIEHALDESTLPMKVDVVDFYRASTVFQHVIKRRYEVLL